MFGNLLNIAASVIPQQQVQWYRFVSRTQDGRGRWHNTYDDPITLTGSFQPVDNRTAKEMGFDVSETYASLHTSADLSGVQRGEAPDKVVYNGIAYEIMGEPGDWFSQDGWKNIYLVKVGDL